MTTKMITYWTTTVLLALALLSGGLAELARVPQTVDGIVHLGFPVYFVTLIGFWKVLGGTAILLPGFPRLKEWAYAGIFFNMTGAAVSHAASRDAAWHVFVTLLLAVLAVVSWAFRPPSRTLGVLVPPNAHGYRNAYDQPQ